jgi:hypothetical protein
MIWMRIKDTRGWIGGRPDAGVDESLLLILRWSGCCGVTPCYRPRFRFRSRLDVMIRDGVSMRRCVSDLVGLHSPDHCPTPIWSGMETRKLTVEP